MDAKRGVYTAYLCSAGKYSSASIPGLKKAREESVRASLECRRAAVDDDGAVASACAICSELGLECRRTGTYGIKSVQRPEDISLDVLADRHVLNLTDEGDDALEGFLAALKVLPRSLTHKRIELPVGEGLSIVRGDTLGKTGDAQEGQQLALERLKS